MTTTAGVPMPPLDVSAALQAAVAAAAEIARVGLSEDLTFVAPAPVVEQDVPAAKEHESLTSPEVNVNDAVAQQHYKQPAAAETPALESAASSFSDQCTGQDAAGDHDLHSDSDMINSGAAGERTFEESEEDAAKRLARSRERNREHARRTRLRKKAQLEALQSKVRGLEAEKKGLKQKIEECSIASILINLAEPSQDEEQQSQEALLDATIQKSENSSDHEAKISLLTAGKRKRFASVDTSEENRAPQTLKLLIDGQTRLIGPKSHINWKSGVYSDEHGVQRQLTAEQLESLRRERNRMHAKMTRDRKKNFIATIEKTIEELERDCQKMRDVLDKVGAHQHVLATPVTPIASPRIEVKPEPAVPVPPPVSAAQPATSSLLSAAIAMAPQPVMKDAHPEQDHAPKRAKVSHGFSWIS